MLRFAFVFGASLAMFACLSSQADAAQCGSSAGGYAAWKQEFARPSASRGVGARTPSSASTATNYAQATIYADCGQRSLPALARTVSREAWHPRRSSRAAALLKQSQGALSALIQSPRRAPAAGPAARDPFSMGDWLLGASVNEKNQPALIVMLCLLICSRFAPIRTRRPLRGAATDRFVAQPLAGPACPHVRRSRPDRVHAKGHPGLRHMAHPRNAANAPTSTRTLPSRTAGVLPRSTSRRAELRRDPGLELAAASIRRRRLRSMGRYIDGGGGERGLRREALCWSFPRKAGTDNQAGWSR